MAAALEVERAAGRWSAIVKPNGAGKSTLLRVLAGLQGGHCGEMQLGSVPLGGLSGPERARRLSWLGAGRGQNDDEIEEGETNGGTIAGPKRDRKHWRGFPGQFVIPSGATGRETSMRNAFRPL